MMKQPQKIYQFSLILKNIEEDTPKLEDSLYQAGCDDALINFRNGTVYLDFDRKAPSLEDAVMSAIKDVESSSVGAIVASLAPEDLVTEAEIAKRSNYKRQTVSLWINGERRSSKKIFPKPVMKLSERSPLWRWHEVVAWLYDNKIIFDDELVKNAAFLENMSVVLEERDETIKAARQNLFKKFKSYKQTSHVSK